MTKLFLLLFFYFFYILPIYSQFCSSDDFIVRKRGIDYLRIHGPTEVITCNSQNICLFDQDSTNEIQTLSLDGELLTLSLNGSSVLVDPDSTNEIQTLSKVGAVISLSNGGGSVTLVDDSTTNEIQSLSIVNGIISLTNGGSVALPDSSSTNELQVLSKTGTVISLSTPEDLLPLMMMTLPTKYKLSRFLGLRYH